MATKSKNPLLLFLYLSAIVIVIYTIWQNLFITNAMMMPKYAMTNTQWAPNFAIIVQTESCIPGHVATDEYFGNSTLCDCHVYVVSYKNECEDSTRSLWHILYIFKPRVAWTGGRNAAFSAAKKSGYRYLYFITSDDDIVLEYNKHTPPELKEKPPLKTFTNFLLEYEPAGASTDYKHTNQVDAMIATWRDKCKKSQVPAAGFPVKHFDQCFNAYHRDTISTVIPYTEVFDATSWWISALQFAFMFQFAFYGQFVSFPYVKATNPKHGRYTQVGHLQEKWVRERIVQDMRSHAPPAYVNNSIYGYVMNYQMKGVHVHMWCIDPVPAKSPIIPYKTMHTFTKDDY